MEFKKVQNDIVPIYENETKEKLINARELHSALKSKRKFSDWIKQRIEKYEFIENEDFIPFHNFVKGDRNGYGNKTSIEYYLTIDTAKEICMIENNSTGRKIRKYFIETEKRYRKIIKNPSNIFDFMRFALNQIESNENRITKVETEVEKIKSKIDVVIKNNYYQVYYKPKAVEEITKWFNTNKEEIEYKIIYEKNTKNGKERRGDGTRV